MAQENGESISLTKALEIEVRLISEDDQAPIWSEERDETRHWIQDIVQRVMHDTLGGVVELGHEYVEADYIAEVVTVFSAPTEQNKERLRGDLHWLVNRLERELEAKFSPKHARPVVHVEADKAFFQAAAPGARGGEIAPRGAQAGSGPAEVYTAAPVGGGYGAAGGGNHNGEGEPRLRISALMWTGAALGGMLIANVFLLFNNYELRQQLQNQPATAEELAQLRVDLRDAGKALEFEVQARAFEKAECARSIEEHRAMIRDLAASCTAEAPPQPPRDPQPYPQDPNPFR